MLIALACLTLGPQAIAGDPNAEKLDVTRNGVTTTLVLPVYKSGDLPYASLSDITRQLGGTVTVQGKSAIVRLGSASVETVLEERAIRAGGKSLSLQHPIRGYSNDALIAIADLMPLLREGFGYGSPDLPPTGSALRLEPMDVPMEPIAEPPTTEVDIPESLSLDSVSPPVPSGLESAAVAEPAARPKGSPAFPNTGQFLLAIDPGHGGEDTGAVSAGGLTEKDICLTVANELRKILKEQYGIASMMTREKDEAVTLKQRAGAVAREKANLVISVHCGANLAPGAGGPLVFAHRPLQSLSVDPKPGLAAAETLARAMDGVASNGAPPIHEIPLALLRAKDIPGVLIELGNLSSPDDETRLANSGYISRLAAALAAGINQLLGREAPAGVVQ